VSALAAGAERTAALDSALAPPSPPLDGLAIDPERRRANVGAAELYLSEAEFSLLSVLISQPGRLFTHAELGEVCFEGVRRIERCAERLARKLELRGMEAHLRCEPGVGLALDVGAQATGVR
jgi:DNA-binding response OmpR family regulator